MNYSYTETNRIGDHIWWISDVSKFKEHYPTWQYKYNLQDILIQIFEGLSSRD
jgi:CDP-paratose 2-epimerase